MAGTVIGEKWYNDVSKALNCAEGTIFNGFNNTTGEVICSTDFFVNGDVQSGTGSGGVALTINDGYGNANITFNHQDGTPEQDGNAARIEVNTDSTTNAIMDFELKAGVSEGSATNLSNIMRLQSDGKVGIGATDTDARLTITGGGDIVNANHTGRAQLLLQDSTGNTSGTKMRIDANEIQTSKDGSATGMMINKFGGDVTVGG